MKFSGIPFSFALLFWILFKPLYALPKDSPYENYWGPGPYITIFAAVFSICKGVHFIYYNSKKRMAQGAASYLSMMDDISTPEILTLEGESKSFKRLSDGVIVTFG